MVVMANLKKDMQAQIKVLTRTMVILDLKLLIKKTKWMLHRGDLLIITSEKGMTAWHIKEAEKATEFVNLKVFKQNNKLIILWPPQVKKKGKMKAECPYQQCKFATNWK
jgi:thymidylate synthase